MKSLVIVDIQKEFNKFIQYDLVDEVYEYAKEFDKVYQIWDTNKGNETPTYKFPNEVYDVKKKYGKNHFSPKVKKFIQKMTDETPEGNKFKLSDENGYIVRVDNNHDWFYANPELVDLVEDLENDKVILVGGADNECLEDVYQMFIAFGVDVDINKRYVYSAKTNSNTSINDDIKENNILKFSDFNILESTTNYLYNSVAFICNNKEETLTVIKNLKENGFAIKGEFRFNNYPIYLFANISKYDDEWYVSFLNPERAIIPIDELLKKEERNFHPKVFDYKESKYVMDILKKGVSVPSYKPRNINRLTESDDKYLYDSIIFQVNDENESEIAQSNLIENGFKIQNYIVFFAYPSYLIANTYYKGKTMYVSYLEGAEELLSIDGLIQRDTNRNFYYKILNYNDTEHVMTIFKKGGISPSYKPRNIIKESTQTSYYRFKTREELEKEFGDNWMNLNWWNSFMDKFLGMELPPIVDNDYIEKTKDIDGSGLEYIILPRNIDSFSFSFPLRTLKEMKIPSYKKRKIIK